MLPRIVSHNLETEEGFQMQAATMSKFRLACCLSVVIASAAVGWSEPLAGGGNVAAAEPGSSPRVADRLWIWTHPVGAHDGIDLGGGRQGKSRMTPVQGADYLGVPNLYFIHFPNNPPASQFPKYALDFRPMKRVVWSLTGAGGDTSAAGRETVLKLAAEFPNITGYVLDDFLNWSDDSAPDPWLAANNVQFPVSLVLQPPAPVAIDRIVLVQTQWPSGDYRSKDFIVEMSEDGKGWGEAGRGILPNTPAAKAEIKLTGRKVVALRVRILSTHDAQAARSCGLAEVQLWDANRRVPVAGWKASASSIYSDRFVADNAVGAAKPTPEALDTRPVPASMTVEQLKAMREQIAIQGRKLPITCVIYTHQISPRILPHVDRVDKVAMWTWRSEDLANLETNFERLRQVVRSKPILLGCYLFDYGGNKQMTVDRMKRQCEFGLRWLHEGKIEGMIFLASNVCDMDLPAVEWTRKWIASVGEQRIGAR
jgi:hypothetical protein